MVAESEFWLSGGTTFYKNGSNVALTGINGSSPTENLTPSLYNTSSSFNVGHLANVVFAQQKISELIVYLTDQSANRSAIESNINTYFSIY